MQFTIHVYLDPVREGRPSQGQIDCHILRIDWTIKGPAMYIRLPETYKSL